MLRTPPQGSISRNEYDELQSFWTAKPYPSTLEFETLNSDKYYKIFALSKDGSIIYAGNGSATLQSTDEGETWQYINMKNPAGRPVVAIRELDDGELLIVSDKNATTGIKSKIYKTSGYDRDNLDYSSIVLNEVLESANENCAFINEWCLSVFGNIVVANEYGSQGSNGALRAYLSVDYGDTWSQIFDLSTTPQNIQGAPPFTEDGHLHSTYYDRYWERIWLVVGDSTNTAVYFSDDFGATWRIASNNVGLGGIQFTNIVAYPEAVFFGSDRFPDGIYIWKRTKSKADQVLIYPYFLTTRSERRSLVYMYAHRNYTEKNEVAYIVANRDDYYSGSMGSIIVGIKGVHGIALLKDFTDDLPLEILTGCVGPTAKGNIITSVKNTATGFYHVLRAKAPIWE